MKRVVILLLTAMALVPVMAQTDSFEEFRRKQLEEFNSFKQDKQKEYDSFRKKINEEYAEFIRRAWETFPAHEAEQPVKEEPVPPVVYNEPEPAPAPAPQPTPEPQPQPKVDEEPTPQPQPKADEQPTPAPQPAPQPTPQPQPETKPQPKEEEKPVEIAVKPEVVVVPAPQPVPEPIAPVKPKEESYKRVSIGYFGTIITIGFPKNDNLKLLALSENAIADAWKQLSDSKYDITVSTALNARKANALCDWAYMKMLETATEKQYGKTNEAVLMQAFLMTQSGYRIRLGMDDKKLYMLVASQYDIFSLDYYLLDGTKFYNVSGDKSVSMKITKANYSKEKSLSLQMTQLPQLSSEPTPKRTLSSKKGVTSSVSVNKNMIDFFNTYPQACFNGDQTTRWAAYANTPMEKTVKDMLYPPLKKTITGMSERDAVGIILNWVQTAFEYEYDDKVWGGDRAFFAQETLYYPYCDCEDRAILFSRLVRDLVGLDVVLLYYPGHLATAVAFSGDVNGDYLTYKNRKYIVCDPTYINAGVGRTMPGMNNQEAKVIALK